MTDRVISYAGALPRVEDFLSVSKYAMVGIGAVAEAILGQSTQVSGLMVTALSNTAVAGSAFAVNIGRGFLFSFQETDPTAFGVLGPDAATNVLKTGILATGVNLGLTNAAPVSAGYSINYLISAAFIEQDINEVVLPYYNAATPSQPFAGPANNAAAQVTARQDTIQLQATAGTSAPTGSQTIPVVPAGYVPLYVVTINNADSAIVNGQISVAPDAPFIESVEELTEIFQSGSTNFAVAGGSANSISLSLVPALTSYRDGIWLTFKAAETNTAATFISINGLSNLSILQGGVALSGGEIIADWSYGGFILSGSLHLMWSGAGPVNVGAGTAAAHAVNISQFPVRFYGFGSQGDYLPEVLVNNTYNLDDVVVTFPDSSKTGAFRVNARLIGAGVSTASNVRQNFQNILNDGTNQYPGGNWLIVSLESGDAWGTSDTILTPATYAPGTTVNFVHNILTGPGSTSFTVAGCSIEVFAEEA